MADTQASLTQSPVILDKRSIATSFSRAASRYDSMAMIQRQVGSKLLHLSRQRLQGQVLDLGCGTGFFSSELLQLSNVEAVLAVDLAEGMLSYGRHNRAHPDIDWICADAESLPFADGSVDAVFSNFSIQWCENLTALFAEVNRVLKPGGMLVFTTLGPDTLKELRYAWAQVDDYVHVNKFQPWSCLQRSLAMGFQSIYVEDELIELEYQRLNQLTGELKGIGAHNLNQGRITGLAGRQRIQAFRQAYESLRKENGLLPATYQLFYGIYQKTALTVA
ncbi:MAG: malonyl-ACP O-methyltransferase BioC [Motiliproteus sp.]